MAKKFVIKVYSKTGAYLNTWDEVVSNISFQNEINTAGGQMTFTLARKAGDYGEGSDVDFGFKVVVYVFDKEAPDGLLLFQGYISSYTPIYKDDSVQITVLSYGSELNDYVIEGGEAVDISTTLNLSSGKAFGGLGNFSDPRDTRLAQTFVSTNTIQINTLEVYAATLQAYSPERGFYDQTNIGLYCEVYTGSTVGSGTRLGFLQTLVLDGTVRKYKMTTTDTISLTAGNSYYFLYSPSSYATNNNYYMLTLIGASAYGSGSLWAYSSSGAG